jgi:hypothetical protein
MMGRALHAILLVQSRATHPLRELSSDGLFEGRHLIDGGKKAAERRISCSTRNKPGLEPSGKAHARNRWKSLERYVMWSSGEHLPAS